MSAAAVAPLPPPSRPTAIEQPVPPCTSFDWQSLPETQLAPTPPEPADEGGIGGADDVGGDCVPPEGDGGVLGPLGVVPPRKPGSACCT
ncbi:MAG: hypothetical protein JWM53_126 [bacterium]|nr:hypothetical protein [bacterium]